MKMLYETGGSKLTKNVPVSIGEASKFCLNDDEVSSPSYYPHFHRPLHPRSMKLSLLSYPYVPSILLHSLHSRISSASLGTDPFKMGDDHRGSLQREERQVDPHGCRMGEGWYLSLPFSLPCLSFPQLSLTLLVPRSLRPALHCASAPGDCPLPKGKERDGVL